MTQPLKIVQMFLNLEIFVILVFINTLLSPRLFVCCTLLVFFSGAFPHFTSCRLLPCASSSSSSDCRPRRRCSSRYLSFSFSVRRDSSCGETPTKPTASRPRLNPSRRVDISLVRRQICSSWAAKRAARHSAIFKWTATPQRQITSGEGFENKTAVNKQATKIRLHVTEIRNETIIWQYSAAVINYCIIIYTSYKVFVLCFEVSGRDFAGVDHFNNNVSSQNLQ